MRTGVDDIRAIFEDAAAVDRSALEARWDRLPTPIQRYFLETTSPRAPAIRTARLRHGGTFRVGPKARWFPIEAEEYFTAARPGFVWLAKLRLAPMLWIHARDRFMNGRGGMRIRPLSLFTVADVSGPEIDQGSALRWLAEAVWLPYALAGDAIEWTAIDDRSACASLREGSPLVRATFDVDGDGHIVALRAERYRDLGGGRSALTPWSGRYSEYADFGGFRVPTSVEVTWHLETGPFCYARFAITALEYNAAGPF